MKKLVLLLFVVATIFSCTVVKQGELGVKRKLGKFQEKELSAGFYTFNPFTTVVLVVPVRTVNMEQILPLPSKEGLTVRTDIAMLYRVKAGYVVPLLEEVGANFERVLMSNTFRSAAADITSNYMAKDMHSGKRAEIEERIRDKMKEELEDRGIVVERVLLKSIELPTELSNAIERKLKAEQESQQMEYILQREVQEAERRKIDAQGRAEAQNILQSSLSEEILRLRAIEAFKELSQSNNAKIIITDGKTPFVLPEQ
ncbi:MAG: prohibitin family protein [Cyclobacteriaceae bacterium]|nr:prohibitin family protein [Cyclobacteriaceae bacterium]MCH8516434.1 prohibitin family protein [Cyclobacteriaceae bacterium]